MFIEDKLIIALSLSFYDECCVLDHSEPHKFAARQISLSLRIINHASNGTVRWFIIKHQESERFTLVKLAGRNKRKRKKGQRRHLLLGVMNKSRAQIIRGTKGARR